MSRPGPTWVVAGTSDVRDIITGIAYQEGRETVATVATDLGGDLLKKHCPAAKVLVGRLDPDGMKQLIHDEGIEHIVDASHPFAAEVSRNVIDVAAELGIDYLRFERPGIGPIESPVVKMADSIESAARMAAAMGPRMLVTTGSKNIRVFADVAKRCGVKVFARVLDVPASLEAAREAGLTEEGIIKFSGSQDGVDIFDLLNEIQPTAVVSKDSGITGGTVEKIVACEALNVPIIIVGRPSIDYPKTVNTVQAAVEAVAVWA